MGAVRNAVKTVAAGVKSVGNAAINTVGKVVGGVAGAIDPAAGRSINNAVNKVTTATDQASKGNFVPLRDIAETGAVLAGNYFLPGSSILTSNLASKGSQDQLNSDFGKVGQIATGGAGALNGNLANYGKIANSIGLGSSPATGGVGADAASGGGFSLGGSGLGTDLLKIGGKMLLSGALGDNGQGAAQDSASNAAHTAEQIASEQWGSYKKNFLPVEEKMSAMAMNAGSDANIAQEGDIAGANAENQISLANAAKTRGLQRMGVNPNSGNALALANENANNEALTRTTAINGARRNTMNDAFTKVQSTVNAGKGTPATSMTGLSDAVNNYGKVAQTAGNNNALTDKLVSKGVDWALSKL